MIIITDALSPLASLVASAPKQVLRRLPRVLAYDASSSSDFGHGWIAMTRVPGTPLAECWLEFDLDQRKRSIEELASFTRKLARFKSSNAIGSIATAHLRSTSQAADTGRLSVRAPLSLPGRNGANNLRPFAHSTTLAQSEHQSTASFLACAIEAEIAFLRQHQKPAVRCFNVNMLRLRQCGQEDEIPVDASFGSTTSATYKKQLRALGNLAQDIVAPISSSERFVLAHLDLSLENILVDPETGAVTGIVDWEFSGFVPDWMALAPPSWISDEWLPSWNGSNWSAEGHECELDPFDVGHLFDAAQSESLRAIWAKEVTWDAETMTAAQQKAQEKRKMWKACMSEWHQLERACAWARGVVSSRLQSQNDDEFQRRQVDALYSDSEMAHEDSADCRARCNSPSTADSSIGPYTPVDAVRDLPFMHPSIGEVGIAVKEKERYDLKLALEYMSRQASDDGDDEDEGSEDEDSESSEADADAADDDFDFEEFAMAFAPPPLPHIAPPLSVTVTLASPLSPAITSREASFDSFDSLDVTPTRSKRPTSFAADSTGRFVAFMNSTAPPSKLPPGSLWGAFWETPKLDVSRDLDFVIERDLDAGW